MVECARRFVSIRWARKEHMHSDHVENLLTAYRLYFPFVEEQRRESLDQVNVKSVALGAKHFFRDVS